jgi:hypothetical protein
MIHNTKGQMDSVAQLLQTGLGYVRSGVVSGWW